MLRTEWPITDQDVFQNWLREILSPQQIDEFFREKEFDGSHAFPFVRIRINLLDSLRGPAMVLRLIPQTILTMEQLNLPDVLRSWLHDPRVDSGHWSDRIRQEHNPGGDDRLDQPQ